MAMDATAAMLSRISTTLQCSTAYYRFTEDAIRKRRAEWRSIHGAHTETGFCSLNSNKDSVFFTVSRSVCVWLWMWIGSTREWAYTKAIYGVLLYYGRWDLFSAAGAAAAVAAATSASFSLIVCRLSVVWLEYYLFPFLFQFKKKSVRLSVEAVAMQQAAWNKQNKKTQCESPMYHERRTLHAAAQVTSFCIFCPFFFSFFSQTKRSPN